MKTLEMKKRAFCIAMATVIILLFCFGLKANANSSRPEDYKYFTVIRVEAGDTLTSIAASYYDDSHYSSFQSYLNEIMFSNHIVDPDLLEAGQNLVIPYYSSEYRL